MLNTKIKALVCGFVFSVLFSFMNFSGKCQNISNKILRLHIIANSDSKEDQNLKLKIRDRILKDFGSELSGATDLLEAKDITYENINLIKEIVQSEVIANGYNYDVKAEIVNMKFNTREYGNITLPAGNYEALRITLGEAKGHNWWCVMFPPMCLPAAESEVEMNSVLSSAEYDIVIGENKYRLGFKILELVSDVSDFLTDNFYNPVKHFLQNLNLEYEPEFKIKEIYEEIIKS